MRTIFSFLILFCYSISSHAQHGEWFRDDFNSNSQNWYTGASADMECILSDGQYIIFNKKENKNVQWIKKNIYIDPMKDFSMEAKLKIPENKSGGVAGIFIDNIYGIKNFFCMNPYNNSFWIGYLTPNNDYYNLTNSEIGKANSGWQQTNAYTSITNCQVLKIQKKTDQIYFYINNQEVFRIESHQFCQDINKYIGFMTSAKMEVAIDYVIFDQDNWQRVLAADALPLIGTPLPNTINTYATEANPVLSADKKTLYFSRLGYKDNYPGDDVTDGKFHDGDIYFSEYKDSAWTEAKRLEYGISNNGDNAVASVSPDGNTLILFGTYYKNKNYSDLSNGLAISYRLTSGWSYPTNITIKNFYTYPCVVNYFLADNGRVLILCLKRDDSKGGSDFYVSFKQKNNSWSEPKHMGNTINTPSTDFSPFISADNKTMYFASIDLAGYGDADMYMTKRLDDSWTNWSDPVNLGPAINNDAFNANYKISADGSVVYYTSSKNAIGYTDIFMSKLPKKISPDPVTIIKGRVLDWKTKLPVTAAIMYENLGDSSTVGDCRSNPTDGSYTMILPYGNTYGYYAQAVGYISVNENIDLQKAEPYKDIFKDIYLIPIEEGQTINLNNVFFVRSKTELLPLSYPELDRLVLLLKKYPSLEIEIRAIQTIKVMRI